MKTKKISPLVLVKTNLGSGRKLIVEQRRSGNNLELQLKLNTKVQCLLHWGIPVENDGKWQQPEPSLWPQNTVVHGNSAVQSPFTPQGGGMTLSLNLGPAPKINNIAFVLFFPEENRWEDNKGRNFIISIGREAERRSISPLQTLKSETGDREPVFLNSFAPADNYELAVAVIKEEEQYTVQLLTNLTSPLLLHWGLARKSRNDWQVPPKNILPNNSVIYESGAARTPFTKREDGLLDLSLSIPAAETPQGISCAL